MILYSITYSVEKASIEAWLQFMKTEITSAYLQLGPFSSNKIFRLLNEEYTSEGYTYSFQYFCNTLDELEQFRDSLEESIEVKLYQQFANKFVLFKTWLEEV